MATTYYISVKATTGYSSLAMYKYKELKYGSKPSGGTSKSIPIASSVTRSSIETITVNKKNYKVWKIKYNSKTYYVNPDTFVKRITYYLSKKTKRKTSDGTIKSTYKYKDKGYMVYLLASSLKSGKKLNKCYMVKDKAIGYFYGTELTKTKPKTSSSNGNKNSSNNSNKDDNKNSTEKTTTAKNLTESARKKINKYLIPSLIPYGIYTESQIQYKKFFRFFRDPVMEPNNAINGTKEYLFFTKPDLHLLKSSNGTLVLQDELANNSFFKEMRVRYPDLLLQLQHSADAAAYNSRYKNNYSRYLSQTLSYYVTGNLDLTSTTATTIDTPETIYGNSIMYRRDGHADEFNIDFSISFRDDRNLTMYHYFKIWEEYEKLKSKGMVTPPKQSYTTNKILHDQIGIYKFIVDSDGETILYYAYIVGCFPKTVPRDTFSNLTENPIYNIDWHGFHIEDMNPEIISDFNFVATNRNSYGIYADTSKASSYVKNLMDKDLLAPMYDDRYNEPYRYPLAFPYVAAYHDPNSFNKIIYKLVWRRSDGIYSNFNKNREKELNL